MEKVAFVFCSNTIGGHELQSVKFAQVASEFCNPVVILNTPEQESILNNIDLDYMVSPFPFLKKGNFVLQFFFSLIYGSRIRHMLDGYDAIVVCAGTVEAGVCLGYSLIRKDVSLYQYVPMFVDRIVFWGKLGCVYNSLTKLFLYPYDRVFTINRIQGCFLSKFSKVSILPNHINHMSRRKVLPLDRKKRLYFVGRFEKQKRLLQLIDWLDCDLNPFESLVLVGSGSDESRLRYRAKTAVHIDVAFKGWMSLDDQDREFSSNDVFIINSLHEGEPMVIMEANSRGSIVLARNIPGVRGCTYSSNRFDSADELLVLIKLAYKGELNAFPVKDSCWILERRRNVIKEIFV